MRLTRKSWVLMAIAVAMLVLAGLTRVGGPPPAEELPSLAAVAPKDVDRVVISTLVDKLILERKGGAWALTAPIQYPADPALVEGLITGLAGARMSEQLDKGNLETYGVDDQHALNVELWSGGETPSVSLMVGKSAGTASVFARLPGTQEVYRADVGNRARFERAAAEWRDKVALEVDRDKVVAIDIERAGEPLHFTRGGADADWSLAGGAPVDQATLELLLRTASKVRASQIHSPDYEAGFAAPLATVRLTLADGAAHQLLLGSREDGGVSFVRVDGRADVYRTGPQLRRFVTAPVDAFRDRALLRFDPAKVDEVSLVEAGLTIRIGLNADRTAWTILQPPNMDADQELIQRAVVALAELRASRIAADTAFNATGTALSVKLVDGSVQTLRFGQLIKGAEGQGDLVRVKVDGREALYDLAVAAFSELRRALGRG